MLFAHNGMHYIPSSSYAPATKIHKKTHTSSMATFQAQSVIKYVKRKKKND
jgi:hypothetical protein